MTAEGSPRVLWLTEHFPPARGGMAQSCDRIVAGLRARDVTVDVAFISRRHRENARVLQTRGMRFNVPWSEDGAYALQRLWLDITAAGHRYTHVVAFGGHLPVTAGPVFSRWLDVPLTTLFRGNDLDAGIFSPRRAHLVERAIRASRTIVTVSRDAKRKIGALFNVRDKTRFIPNGIDLTDWSPLESERVQCERLREDLVAPLAAADGEQTRPLVVGLVGHLKAKKGAEFLLRAAIDAGLEAHLAFLVVGHADEDTEQFLVEAATYLRIKRLPFLDRSELLTVYPALDVVALPSFFDGMPNVMLEAMGLSVPVLGARVGGIPDVVSDGEQGILFDAGQPDSLREALARFVELSPEERLAMGRAAHGRVAGAFSADRESAAYADVLRHQQEQT